MKKATPDEIKEAYKYFFMVKGHLNCTEKTALASADGYFKRLWYDGCAGAPLYLYEEQFEKAWAEKKWQARRLKLSQKRTGLT